MLASTLLWGSTLECLGLPGSSVVDESLGRFSLRQVIGSLPPGVALMVCLKGLLGGSLQGVARLIPA